MAPDHQKSARLSILDRLTDLEPDSRTEARLSHEEEIRQIKASVCRDLTALLNTRRLEDHVDPRYEEAANSLLAFGVADFTSFNLKNRIEQDRVRRSIESAIRKFEPRLSRVTVLMEDIDPFKPVLQFQIAAHLRIEFTSEEVLFDVNLPRDTRCIAVSTANS
jgi:type VI secretion system protein ImpF